MRKWFVPLMVLGAGSVGAFFLTDKGRATLRSWLSRLDDDPECWEEWNDATETELQRIKACLDQISQSLDPHGEPGH
jgi:DNA-binding PadR family transcriptional regulator